MSESSSRRAKGGSRVRSRAEARPALSETESAASASLAELRRRAAHRLREIGVSLERVRKQYEEAAAECARLRAGGEPTAARGLAEPMPADREEGAAAADHGDAKRLEAQVAELKHRLDEAATLLASEHARSEKLKGSLCEVERELAEATEALKIERARRGAIEVEAENLRAELQQLRDEGSRIPEDSAEGWRKRVVQLQIDLRRALADNGQLRDEMAGLVRFLDELGAVLSSPAAAAG